MDECVILSMRATLVDARLECFSKTARSRPRHREAVRNGLDVGSPAVLGRRLADYGPERAAEGAEAREADVEADLGHAALGLPQEEHRPLDAPALKVTVRRLAERGAEGADEVRLRHVGDTRERRDVERLRVAAVHRVSCAEQAAVGLLDFATHDMHHPEVAM